MSKLSNAQQIAEFYNFSVKDFEVDFYNWGSSVSENIVDKKIKINGNVTLLPCTDGSTLRSDKNKQYLEVI